MARLPSARSQARPSKGAATPRLPNVKRHAIGLAEIEKPEPLQARGGVWFRVGSQQLHVGVDPGFAPARKAHPAFTVPRYDELQDRLRAAGVEIDDDVSIPGVRRCYIADPWGNRIELVAG